MLSPVKSRCFLSNPFLESWICEGAPCECSIDFLEGFPRFSPFFLRREGMTFRCVFNITGRRPPILRWFCPEFIKKAAVKWGFLKISGKSWLSCPESSWSSIGNLRGNVLVLAGTAMAADLSCPLDPLPARDPVG